MKIIAMLLFGWMWFQAAAPAQNPKVSLETQNAILKVQLQQRAIQEDWKTCQAFIADAKEKAPGIDAQLQGLIKKAYADAGLKVEEYDLNPGTFEFTRRVVPTVVPTPIPPTPAVKEKP